MTLANVLTALHGNANINITLVDAQGVELITFGAPGYEAIESDLGTRPVTAITIESGAKVRIAVGDAVTVTPSSDPDPSGDPSGDPDPNGGGD